MQSNKATNKRMKYSSESRMGAACAIVGSVVLFVGTYLHPLYADPHDVAAAFAEYAADRLWVASHLTQLAGVVLIVAALLSLAHQLEVTSHTGWSHLAGGGLYPRRAEVAHEATFRVLIPHGLHRPVF